MSRTELNLTLVGWVGTAPKLYTEANKTPYTSFRMASTRSHFDPASNGWVDGRTEWFTIKAFRQQAINVAESLRKSDPVLVHGRLCTDEWAGPDGPRMSLVLEAYAIGADLTFGQGRFARTEPRSSVADVPGPGVGGAAARGDVGDPPPEDPWLTDGALPADLDAEGLDDDELDAQVVGSAR